MATITTQALPYFCDPQELPGPLPSRDEIEAATHFLPSIHERQYQTIVVVRDKFVVKHGVQHCVSENEGHALLFLHQHLTIPVPRLYAMYREGDRLFLIMEFKNGVRLEDTWNDLSEHDKIDITNQLREVFTQVRRIPPPASFRFGSVVGGPLPHRYFLSISPDPEINGPFNDEKDFSMAIALRSQRNWDHHSGRAWTSEFFARNLPSALSGHASVFTHADLQRKNILVEKITPSPGNENSQGSQWRVNAVVDWETAGWYPSYWEYACKFVYFIWGDDWPEKFERIVDPCPLQAGLLRFVREDLDF